MKGRGGESIGREMISCEEGEWKDLQWDKWVCVEIPQLCEQLSPEVSLLKSE